VGPPGLEPGTNRLCGFAGLWRRPRAHGRAAPSRRTAAPELAAQDLSERTMRDHRLVHAQKFWL
jgi:hypothetical protein